MDGRVIDIGQRARPPNHGLMAQDKARITGAASSRHRHACQSCLNMRLSACTPVCRAHSRWKMGRADQPSCTGNPT